jgi:type I restriction enzyme M protein
MPPTVALLLKYMYNKCRKVKTMLTGTLKNKADAIWEIFWTGGLTNPLDVIEQMTYLMFIHDLDEADARRIKEAAWLGLPYASLFDGTVTIQGSETPANHHIYRV